MIDIELARMKKIMTVNTKILWQEIEDLFFAQKNVLTLIITIKSKIANSKLNGKEGNLKILQSLTCSKNSITINQHILESYGFDFEKYDQKANVSSTNIGLLFRNFILQRSLNNKNEVIIIKT